MSFSDMKLRRKKIHRMCRTPDAPFTKIQYHEGNKGKSEGAMERMKEDSRDISSNAMNGVYCYFIQND